MSRRSRELARKDAVSRGRKQRSLCGLSPGRARGSRHPRRVHSGPGFARPVSGACSRAPPGVPPTGTQRETEVGLQACALQPPDSGWSPGTAHCREAPRSLGLVPQPQALRVTRCPQRCSVGRSGPRAGRRTLRAGAWPQSTAREPLVRNKNKRKTMEEISSPDENWVVGQEQLVLP